MARSFLLELLLSSVSTVGEAHAATCSGSGAVTEPARNRHRRSFCRVATTSKRPRRESQPSTLRRLPAGETAIMLITVAGTVATGNLAIGVGLGVLTAMALFARRVAHLIDVERVEAPAGQLATYTVSGEVFFASDQEFIDAFDFLGDPPNVVIDMSGAHVWDSSAVAALDVIEMHYRRHDISVEIKGLNAASQRLRSALSAPASSVN